MADDDLRRDVLRHGEEVENDDLLHDEVVDDALVVAYVLLLVQLRYEPIEVVVLQEYVQDVQVDSKQLHVAEALEGSCSATGCSLGHLGCEIAGYRQGHLEAGSRGTVEGGTLKEGIGLEVGIGCLAEEDTGRFAEEGIGNFAEEGIGHFVEEGTTHFVEEGIGHFVEEGIGRLAVEGTRYSAMVDIKEARNLGDK